MKKLLAIFLALAGTATLAAPETRTVELQYRPAEDVAAIVRPLAGDAALIPAGDAIILRGEAAVLDALEGAIKRLDVAPRSLRLTVRQGGRAARLAEDIAAAPATRLYGTRDRQSPERVQTLQVLEGGWARIATGRAIPHVNQSIAIGPGGAVVQQNTEYKDVDSGFEVRPRVVGDTVHLAIRAYQGGVSRHGGGVIDTQTVETTVQGALGTWITLGAQDSERRQSGRGTVYSTRSRAVDARSIQIKVELVP
ncbi:MAG: hypothetical protein M0R77_18210 [Gammaproteobacteria bacterium]|nr:hypothetical protein [Gammaproteobacteria bacterium]